MVIAADGVNSVIARRLGINPGWPRARLALDMMEETPVATLRPAEPGTLSVFYGYGGAHGYAYIFPKKAHLNVGIGYVLPYFDEQVDVAPYDLQRSFVGDLRGAAWWKGSRGATTSRRSSFRSAGRCKTTAEGRVLLAGDAGGFVNGFSAEGIYYAMVTGDLAARRDARRARRPASSIRPARAAPTSAPGGGRSAPSCATRCSSRSICSTRRSGWTASSRGAQRAAGVLRDPRRLRERPAVVSRGAAAAALALSASAAAPGDGRLARAARRRRI